MKIIYFGTSAFAVPCLIKLHEAGHTVARCVTQPDRPKGRGLKPEPSPVKEAARRLGIPLAQPERLTQEALGGCDADVGVVAAYGQLIRRDVLDHPRLGILGVHPSLLPKYRGAAPIAWPILNGEAITGTTIFRLNERLDAGEILLQEETPIEPRDTTATLGERLAPFSADALLAALRLLESGEKIFRPQDESLATFAPKFSKMDGKLDWETDAAALERRVRALDPWPGAWMLFAGETVKVWRSSVAERSAASSPPGKILSVDRNGILVSAGEGALQLQELQPAGGKRMPADAFARGHAIAAGQSFGT